MSQDDVERVARAICIDHTIDLRRAQDFARTAITAYLSAMPGRELLADALEALTKTPLIEALTPTSEEWRTCETVQDTYDLMKHRARAAADKIRAAMDKGEPKP